MHRPLLFTILFFTLVMCNHANAQDVRSQLQQLANDLAKQLEVKGKKRVIISSFLNLDNRETQLGRYMADKFSIGIGKAASSLEITDRSQLAEVLRANKMAAERVLDPRTIPGLGKITGAEVIITGNYTALDNTVDITVKAIELERGLRLAVAEGTIPRTSEINKLLDDVSSDPIFEPLGEGGASENIRKDIDKKCATNHTGTYCFQNAIKTDIKIQAGNANFVVHPSQTECIYGMSAGSTGEQVYNLYIYRNAKENNYETRQIVTAECQTKTFIIR